MLIGNNGSGKSSLIEPLETVKTIALEGLDSAMHRWYGFEHVWNLAHTREIEKKQQARPSHAIGIYGQIQ